MILRDYSLVGMMLLHLLSLIWVIPLTAQPENFNQGKFLQSDYYEEIPFELVKGKIIISVSVYGKERKFIIDTGAPTAISESLFTELGLKPVGQENISDINEQSNALIVTKLDDVKLGNTQVAGIPAIVFKESLLTECFDVDGLIGSNLLRNSIVQFDTKAKLIKIASDISKLEVLKRDKNDLVLDRQSSPILKVGVGKNSEMLLFDSG